ncbi:MAG TPA: efflux RND transporter periplasmic adaptor subunit [Candidatus Acidoferrum sp.]|nr:efflux RND transporter periplasmic adaptor subunit [Candidatus Acidoferrum sp.]
MKKFFIIIVVAAVAAAGGWFAAKRSATSVGEKAASSSDRKIAFYQSPMHPWIKSDAPGSCTICGMKLMPVYEGEKGFGGDAEGVTTLGSNIIQVINVQTDEVKKRPLVRTLRVAGMIEENLTKHQRLSSYVDGRIDKLFVNYVGAEVVAGQPLATIYSPMLLTTESEYLTVLRQKAVATSINLQSERSRMLSAATERLKRLGYTDAQITALANKKEAAAQIDVLAPVSGTVVVREVFEGQYLKEGDLLFELADFSQMWFQFDAYERDLSWLRVGQQVDVTTPSMPGKVLSAPITFIDPNLNEMTRSARVRVVIENPIVEESGRKHRLLRNRMFADGAVKIEAPAVVAVPRTAVLAGGPQALAYIDVGSGAYEQRKLKLGRTGDEFVEVLEGLKEGERVVTTGNLLIDSQAQLNATAMGSEPSAEMTDTNATSIESLNEAQQKLAQDFLKLTSELGAALAADDAKKFDELAPRVHADVPKLIEIIGSVKALRPALLELEQSGHVEPAKDLAAARKQFLPFSMAAVDLAKLLRTTDAFKKTKIYNCPMVNRAIPGAAKNGQWIQLAPPLRNPYFGADMLECGTEVKP